MEELINDIIRLFTGPDDPSLIVECAENSTCSTVHAIAGAALVLLILLTGFAYTTWLERRFIARIQSRVGPNRAGPQGLLQPIADAVKLIFKEDVTPRGADRIVYWMSPVIKVIPALIVLAVVPFGPSLLIPWFDGNFYRVAQGIIDPEVGILWILAVTSISVYGVTLAGWASNNKYSMLGALRSSANMISYELSLGMIFAVPVLLAASMSVSDIVNEQAGLLNWYIFHNPLAAAILAIALLAEIGRAPFDMAEAEQELVAGHMTEYSGMKFALFFMAEYINMIGISVIFAALFLGGYDDGFGIVNSAPLLAVPVLAVKVILMLMGLIWVRASIARPRYDRLMHFGWKIMLPGAMLAVAWTAIVVVIAEEGVGDGFYILSSLVLFALIGIVGLWVARATAPKGLGGEDDIFADERIGIGQLILQLVGMLLAIPFALWENLVVPVIRFITNQRETQQPAEEKSGG